MDNSPSWDRPLSRVPEATHVHIERRDVATVSAKERPSTRDYRRYLGIVEVLRAAGWDTERQATDSPFAVEDPSFTAITAQAASELAAIGALTDLDVSQPRRLAEAARAGLNALWDDELGWFCPYDLRERSATGPVTSSGLVALHAEVAPARLKRMLWRLDSWSETVPVAIPTTDPHDDAFDPIRYWRGPVWVLVNWLVADGLTRSGQPQRAEALRSGTRALVEDGFTEYYDPRNSAGIGGHDFSWSAALTLAWLTQPDSAPGLRSEGPEG
jgi:neutral trehalase